MEQLKVGLNEVDLEIVDRLEKLRDGRKQQPVPTEEEIAKRLAVLKGEDPSRMGSLMGNRKVEEKVMNNSQFTVWKRKTE
jgi:hypothetical protein